MNVLLLFLSLCFTVAHAKTGAYEVIRSGCLKEMAHRAHPAQEICDCQNKNLHRRMTPTLTAVLAKTYLGQSIDKEMDTIEGASIVTTYDASVKAECLKNPKYDVGPDDGRDPSAVKTPAKKK